MTDNPVTCPEDLATPPDFNDAAERADLENDAFPKLVSAYNHEPITHAQLAAEIARCNGFRMSVKQALS